MTEIIFQIVKLATMVITFAVVTYLVPFVMTHIMPAITEIITSHEYQRLAAYVKDAVLAVQQLSGVELSGEEKKQIVKDKIARFCETLSCKWTDEEIDDLIEAAVKMMKIVEGK